jgi:glycosyltransferase involved in cell wall biosynthesis
LKILFIADVPIDQPISGAEQVFFQQASGLAKSGRPVWAVARQNDAECGSPCEGLNGVNVLHYRFYSSRLSQILPLMLTLSSGPLSECIDDQRFDAVVAHQPLIFSFLRRRRSLRKLPVVYVYHSPWHAEYLSNNEKRSASVTFLPAFLRKQVERSCVRAAVKVIVLSEYMKRRVMRTHAIAADDIVVNPGGADTQRFESQPDREQLKRKIGFPPGKVHLLTVRNLERRMGLDRLIQSMVYLKKAYPQIYLIIGGSGYEKQRLEGMIRRCRLEKDVRLAGFIPYRRLPDYYAAADFFVLPTRQLEGFGLVTTESLSCGTPVLGTPVGGTPEILKPLNPDFVFQDNTPQAMAEGILFNIKNYFEDKDSYASLRLRCRSYTVTHYSWERHVHLLNDILNCLSA